MNFFRPLRLAKFDLLLAVLVAGGTGLTLLLQRVLIFDSLETPAENTFAQLMAGWAVISVLFGWIQHRSMALAGDGLMEHFPGRSRSSPVEHLLLAAAALAGISAIVVRSPFISLTLSSICYAASLPVLLALLGRAYGNGSATVAQVGSLLIAVIQLGAICALRLLKEPQITQVVATLALFTAAGTWVLRFWWRRCEPIDWVSILMRPRDLFLGSLALGLSWAACQADVFALALAPSDSVYSTFGSALYLGKTGLYAALPIIPILAKYSHSGTLRAHSSTVILACLGAIAASMSVLVGTAMYGVLPSYFLDAEFEVVALISISQAPSVMILVFAYRNAMSPYVRLHATLSPLISLGLVATCNRLLSNHPASGLLINGLCQTALAAALAYSSRQSIDGHAQGLLERRTQLGSTLMSRTDRG